MPKECSEINKVIFTGNLLRIGGDWNVKESNQNKNIEWLYNLLGNTLNKVTNKKCYPLYWDERSEFQSSVIYSLQGLRISVESSALLYNSKKIHPEVISYFKFFFENALVIGIELPPFFIKIFDKLKIPYIDFMFYPARFMNDLCLGVRTNHLNIYNKVLGYELCDGLLSANVGVCKARLSKMNGLNLRSNSALFAGQVEFDTSLIKNDGSFHNLLEFKERLIEISKDYECFYFKPHPYQKNNKDFLSLLSSIENAELIEGNFYHILNNENISKVFAMTSSVVYEARLFGKDSEWLAAYPFSFTLIDGQEFNKFKYVPILEKFIYPSFWTFILDGVVNVSSTLGFNADYLGYNMVRNALNVNWDYDIFKG